MLVERKGWNSQDGSEQVTRGGGGGCWGQGRAGPYQVGLRKLRLGESFLNFSKAEASLWVQVLVSPRSDLTLPDFSPGVPGRPQTCAGGTEAGNDTPAGSQNESS